MKFSLDFVSPAGCASPADFELIETAFNFAQTAHQGQQRKSGEPYFSHLYAVGKVSWEKYHDPVLTAAALLHDTVEDCETVERAHIYTTFGEEVGFLVDAASKNHFDFYRQKETFTDKIVRFLWAVARDIRAGLLKLADREHNLSTIKFLIPDKQIRISFETQAIYEPLKKILSYDTPVSLSETLTRFTAFTAAHQLSTPLAVKEQLFQETFENINHNLYPIIYENTASVVWKVEGMEMYLFLCNSKIFENRIKFVEVTASADSEDDVEAFFKFKTGAMAENNEITYQRQTENLFLASAS